MQTEPIFLVAMRRSGTTLLRLMLGSHPEIFWSGEFNFVVCKIHDDAWPNLQEYYNFLETDRLFRSLNIVINKELNYTELVKSFEAQLRKRTTKKIFGATVHCNFDKILKIWPNARFIHVVRDPRDVAKSFVKIGWLGNVWCSADGWVEAEKALEKMKKVIPSDRWIELKYECLITNPENELKRLCGFIGVPYSNHMLAYDKTSTYDKPDINLVFQWKKTLSKYEVRLVESKTSKMLLDRQYELSGLPNIKLSSTAKKLLIAENKIIQVYFQIRKYGLLIYILWFTARRLKLKKLHDWVTLMRNDIDIKHLK